MTSRVRDAVVVGGGPAGLAFAAAAAERGLSVSVLEKGSGPPDKACGEGILPAGLRALDALGVLPLLSPADAVPFREIRWFDPSGATVHVPLPAPGGLGVRRTALAAALASRAARAGVEVVHGAEVRSHARAGDRVVATTAEGRRFEARVLVAADGLASAVRRREGLDAPASARARYGLRRHFAVPPWADAVEVHFADGCEAYVTPAGTRRVGVAILFERDAGARYDEMLRRFPGLAALLDGAPYDSAPRGAGPLARSARARVADRLVLLGDAAGYLDAVTGEGVSLALGCALDLAALLPDALARGAGADALRPYERAWAARFRPYAAWTRTMLAVTRRPRLRRALLSLVESRSVVLERLVERAVG